MKVLDYLKENTLEQLKEELAIKVSVDERYPELYVLNYNQIDSPKNHPIVKECRSLVLQSKDGKEFSIVSRAFDRFFNQGENGEEFDLAKITLYEKVDGSLISVFYTDNYGWMYRTKSMIMPVLSVQGWDRTWKDLIETSLDWNNIKGLEKAYTYIFEVVGRENRIVVNYGEDKAYLLAIRHNEYGEYSHIVTTKYNLPRTYKFSTTEECIKSLKALPNLEEGYVGYKDGVPVVKVKSPQYVAAHLLRGEGLSPKRAIEMVVTNEYDEYFTVFPEDKPYFDKYISAWNTLESLVGSQYESTRNIVEQKDFALANKVFYSGVLFQARNTGNTPVKCLNDLKTSYKIKLLETTLEKINEK